MLITWVNPAGLHRRTGGSLYNHYVIEGLRKLGWTVDVREASEGLVQTGGLTVIDGLIWPDIELRGGSSVVLLHSPLHRERGGDWREREREALATADHIAATSALTLHDLDLEGLVIPPGVHPAPASEGEGLLCVAHLIPRKGHRLLQAALDRMQNPPRIRCVGSAQVEPAYARELMADRRVDWLGELEDLEPEYQRAGLLVHCAEFEAWGMVLDEALAREIAVITTPAGALERCGDQVLVCPRDPEALAELLTRWQSDPAFRAQRREAARRADLPNWEETAMLWSQWLSERTRIG